MAADGVYDAGEDVFAAVFVLEHLADALLGDEVPFEVVEGDCEEDEEYNEGGEQNLNVSLFRH